MITTFPESLEEIAVTPIPPEEETRDLDPGMGRRMLIVALEALLNDPDSSIQEVADLLGLDGKLRDKALLWANSPLFRRRRDEVEDLATAVRILGLRRVGWLCREMAVAA